MADANAIQTHHVVQYSSNVETFLAQSGYRLRPLVRTSTKTGKSAAVVDQIGSLSVVYNRDRNADTSHSNPRTARRWAFPIPVTVSTLVDGLDLQKMLIDPRSTYVEQMAMSLGRADDAEIGRAFFDSALTGENGTTPVAFPSAQEVAANVGGGGSATGLNVTKLRAAKRLFMASGLDLSRERLYIAITSVEHDNLLGELQVTNMDYNDRPTLVDGRVTSFMGFSFVHVEWQATDDEGVAAYERALPLIAPGGLSSTTRHIPAWTSSGIHHCDWKTMVSRVDTRPDKNYATQLWSEMMIGATRTQEKKVVRIICTSA